MTDEMISVVIPEYGGRAMLRELCERLVAALETCVDRFEIILVNDASPDHCWDDIVALGREDPRIRGLDLSRNFGQHSAITAGLAYATGDWVVVMDCDLQDVPEEIPKLYAAAKTGDSQGREYDVVVGQRMARQDSFLKKLGSRLFHRAMDWLTDTKSDGTTANFGIYRRSVVEAILSMGDCIRGLGAMVYWVGFHRCAIPIRHAVRPEGKSSYTLFRLFRSAEASIVGFSDKLLRLILRCGALMTLASFVMICVYLIMALTGRIGVSGYASLIISIWFIGGALMTTLGVIGLYVGRMFEQTKNRPVFVVSRFSNFSPTDSVRGVGKTAGEKANIAEGGSV